MIEDIELAIRKQLLEEGRSYEVACEVAEHFANQLKDKPAGKVKALRDYLIFGGK